MKVTNFENSKALHLAGFKVEGSGLEEYPSFDLETILEALPQILWEGEKDYYFWWDKIRFVYSYNDKWLFESHKKPNESLADCAARLLLLLAEKNLINFK